MKLMIGRKEKTAVASTEPQLSREEIVKKQAQVMLDNLKNSRFGHEASDKYLSGLEKGKEKKGLGSILATVEMIPANLLYTGAEFLVKEAAKEPDGLTAKFVDFTLEHWEKEQEHEAEKQLRRRYGKDVRHMLRPDHMGATIAKKLGEDAVLAEVLKHADDLLGNHFDLHLFKRKGMDDALEVGIDMAGIQTALFVGEYVFRAFQNMTAVAMARDNSGEMTKRLENLVDREKTRLDPIKKALSKSA